MTESTAERVTMLLLAFERPGAGEMTVSELAKVVGRERSQVSRMLRSIAASGLLEQDEVTRAYRLGWRMRVLASHAGDDLLIRTARPVLQRLVAATGEVALLSVQEGNRSLTVLREESSRSLQAGGWVGRRSPLHCSASGRALMFESTDEHIQSLTVDDLTADPMGPSAPRNITTLLNRLAEDRRRGFSVASEEIEVGLTSISAPVRGRHARVVAVINVSGPSSRMTTRIDALGDLVVRAAQTVSNAVALPTFKT